MDRLQWLRERWESVDEASRRTMEAMEAKGMPPRVIQERPDLPAHLEPTLLGYQLLHRDMTGGISMRERMDVLDFIGIEDRSHRTETVFHWLALDGLDRELDKKKEKRKEVGQDFPEPGTTPQRAAGRARGRAKGL